MAELLLFALASIGLCHLLVDSALMTPVKDYLGRRGWQRLVRMLNCYQCSGCWSGLVVGVMLLLGRWQPYLHLLLYGLAAGFLGPLAAVCLGYLNTLTSAAAGQGGQGGNEPDNPPAAGDQAPAAEDGSRELTAALPPADARSAPPPGEGSLVTTDRVCFDRAEPV
jgi:hypothetical protein